MTCLVK
jgi:hypothetical protein